MDTNIIGGLAVAQEIGQVLVAEATEKNTAQKENAPEFAALGTLAVACATTSSTNEYTPNDSECQAISIPTLEEIELAIAAAARQRIESARGELNETSERIARERVAREQTLQAMQARVSQIQAALDRLTSERTATENRARAFLGGDELNAMLGKIHLAFNARQLELEDALATANSDVIDAQAEITAANVSDALEMQLAQQELERLESAAPDVAQMVRLAASAEENLAAALQAVKDGLLKDAAVLLDKAKSGNADLAKIGALEQALDEAKQAQVTRDLVIRMTANADRLGGVRRIRKLMDEAESSGIADQIAPTAERALKIAREAANKRFAQARPIADHLASEGFVPVVADGRIEAWKQMARNGAASRFDSRSADHHSMVWRLERVVVLRDTGEWTSETPRVPMTCQGIPPRVQRSRWFRPAVA